MSILKAVMFAAVATWGAPNVPPMVERPPVQQTGIGTTYGLGGWHGTHTANGAVFRPKARVTCAHKSIPLGTTILVESGDRAIWCRITDRGPYVVQNLDGREKAVTPGYDPRANEEWVRIIDLSVAASKRLGVWGRFRVRLRWRPHGETAGTFVSRSR